MLFLRKKITVAFLALSIVGSHVGADDAGYASKAKQKLSNACDWSVQVTKESYDKVREKANNAYAYGCQKTRALYEKAKEHKFITGVAAYLAVEGLLKLSGSHTLFNRIVFLPGEFNAVNNNLNHANNVTIPVLQNAATVLRDRQEILNAGLNNVREQAQQDQQALRDRIDTLARNHAAEFERLRISNFTDKQDSNQRIHNLYGIELQNLQAEHEQALREQAEQHQQELENARNEQGVTQEQINQIQREHQQAQQDLTTQHQQAQQLLRQESQQALQDRVNELNNAHATELQRLAAQHQQEVLQDVSEQERMMSELEENNVRIEQLTNQKNLAQQELDVLKNQYNYLLNTTHQLNWQNQNQQQQVQNLSNQIQNKEAQIRQIEQGRAREIVHQKHNALVNTLGFMQQELVQLDPNNPYQGIDSDRVIKPLLEQIQSFYACYQLVPIAYTDSSQVPFNFQEIDDLLMNLTHQIINRIFNQISVGAEHLANEFKNMDFDDVSHVNFHENLVYAYDHTNGWFQQLNIAIDQYAFMTKQYEGNHFIQSSLAALDGLKERAIFQSLGSMMQDSSNKVVELSAYKVEDRINVGSYKDKFNLCMHALVAEHACKSYKQFCSVFTADWTQQCLAFVNDIENNIIDPIIVSLDKIDVIENIEPEDFGQVSIIQKKEKNNLIESWMVFASTIDKSMTESMFASVIKPDISKYKDIDFMYSSSVPVDELDDVMRLMDEKNKNEDEEFNKMFKSSIIGFDQSTASSMVKSTVPNMTNSIVNKSGQETQDLTASVSQFFKVTPFVPADKWMFQQEELEKSARFNNRMNFSQFPYFAAKVITNKSVQNNNSPKNNLVSDSSIMDVSGILTPQNNGNTTTNNSPSLTYSALTNELGESIADPKESEQDSKIDPEWFSLKALHRFLDEDADKDPNKR